MLISLHTSIYASDHDACEINPILKSLVNKNPNEEAIDQYNQGRLIYLGIYSYNLEAPGVNADPYCLKDNDKLAVIPSTSDTYCSIEHQRLNELARVFTKIYNEKITEISNREILGECDL
jgi:hypothetical protein